VQAAGGPGATPADVAVLGARDPEEARDIASLRAGALAAVDLLGPGGPRAEGLADAAQRAVQRLGPRFFVHLDLDVLDERAMPATDYLMPGGLGWDELAALLEPLGRSPALAGPSLGCLNPEKDPDGRYTEMTCALLAGALGTR
jgi:arginase